MSVHNLLQDSQLTVVTALPAAAANATSTGVDVGLNRKTWKEEIAVSVPALPNLVNAAVVTFQPMDSADNITFANIVGLGTQVVTGAGGVGSPATTLYWPLPRDARRYIAVNANILTGAGNNTASSFTFYVLAV